MTANVYTIFVLLAVVCLLLVVIVHLSSRDDRRRPRLAQRLQLPRMPARGDNRRAVRGD